MPGFSPKLPLMPSPIDGPYALNYSFRDLVRQNLKMLVLTDPGERIMNPDFGCGIRRILFENFNGDAISDLITRIQSQTKKYMPKVSIMDLQILTTEDDEDISDHAVRVYIKFTVPELNLTEELTFDEQLKES